MKSMVKYKNWVLLFLMLSFFIFSYYPTLYEISQAQKLTAKNRVFILEHNYYWPDFNLYLSKIRQGYEGRFLAVEKYTGEPHRGSLIQEFYLILGKLGNILAISPNYAYQLGRIILAPLLLILIAVLCQFYFKKTFFTVSGFLIILASSSFPRISLDAGSLIIGRYMEWWSNIDSLQRITFIPHILFGQVVSFFLLYKLTLIKPQLTLKKIIFYSLLGNAIGLVFPPSLMTLLGVLILISLFRRRFNKTVLFILCLLPSLIYLYITTKFLPWSALVEFHRSHPMMIPLDQYLLGTGPVIFLGFFGSLLAVINRKKTYYPLILWVAVTFLFASLFSLLKEQSPLRFTQTGLFIPLGILATYFFQTLANLKIKNFVAVLITVYLLGNLLIMKTSLDWQINFINQRVNADIPAVPYPPQTMYPLTEWMAGINWLRDNSQKEDVVLAAITAGNYIPAYAGNFVYFGQSNTVDYERKQAEVDRFFKGEMTHSQARLFLENGRIKYIFLGPQEKEKLGGKNLQEIYSIVKSVFTNNEVTIYRI